jgi:putative protease
MKNPETPLEIMSPAGNPRSFTAALEAGADAIYLGLQQLNARRPAGNFTVSQLRHAVSLAHKSSTRVYLALNIDIKSGELPIAAAILELCRQIGVDAVIVRDFSLLYLFNRYYSESFELHLSTQCAVTASTGLEFAGKVGADRVVLARELSLEEVASISASGAVETEIFVEGSMCFSVSGRCQLSSWVGGKSGNRGLCTAPCRVVYSHAGGKDTPFSMKDLSSSEFLNEIEASGVSAVKIEGRLKKPEWVKMVTGLYKSAMLALKDRSGLSLVREQLKQYSARETSSGHLFKHTEMTGSNREWGTYVKQGDSVRQDPGFSTDTKIHLAIDERFLTINGTAGMETASEQLELPPPPKKGKSLLLGDICNRLGVELQHARVSEYSCSESDVVLPRRFSSKVARSVRSVLFSLESQLDRLPDLEVKITDDIRSTVNSSSRKSLLGDTPNTVLVSVKDAVSLTGRIPREVNVTVYLSTDIGLCKSVIDRLNAREKVRLSLPTVLFESEIAAVDEIINYAFDKGFKSFESNSYEGCTLLDKYDVEKHAGSGLAVSNHLAARFFGERGYRSVYATYEADRAMYHQLSRDCEIECSVMVYGHPVLFQSRVNDRDFQPGKTFKDSIGVELRPFRDCSTTVFIDCEPMSLINQAARDEGIQFDFCVADLRWINKGHDIIERLFSGRSELEFPGATFNFYRKLT